MEPLADADPATPGPQDPLLEPVYRVGAVARLANIPVETLRVWERRYGVVGHAGHRHRHRVYSARDVHRLSLIKKLVDLGSAISAVARLSHPELQQMYVDATGAAHDAPGASPTAAGKLRLILVGPALQARFAAASTVLRSVEVVAHCDDLEAVGAAPGHADVLVVEVDTLQPELADRLDRLLPAVQLRIAIVAYRFAAADVLGEFVMRGHLMQRAPLPLESLEDLCVGLAARRAAPVRQEVAPGDMAPADMPPATAARFDERTLARLANVTSDLRCECPRHVTELLLSLSAFERYSEQCASRGPEDAELHSHLGRVAAYCRVQLEQALIYIARVEGIALTPAD